MSQFRDNLNASVDNILTSALRGDYPVFIGGCREDNLFGPGVSVDIGEQLATSTTLKTRNIVSMSPRASILVKKKAFSSLAPINDLQWMDRTEKLLLRATKALFAYKVAQIRAYESLSKFEDFFTETQQINFNLLAELLHNAKFLEVPQQDVSNTSFEALDLLVNAVSTSLVDYAYDEVKSDVIEMARRNAFASEFNFTTWFVDPDNPDNYGTGPGTGVIELGMFSGFNTETNLNSDPSSAGFELEDPYRISIITEYEIELAIDEALNGTLGLLSELVSGELDPSFFDAKSVVAAGFELLGIGNLDNTIDIPYIRRQLRTFYLGKPFINPSDPIYFYIRGNRTKLDYNDPDSVFQEDELTVDETILEAERILFTNKSMDLDTYKTLRGAADNSLAMQCVFGGRVVSTNRSFNEGRWVLSVNCVDNMGWLTYSRFMITPALQDPQGILEDPLTPYEIPRDASGTPLTGGGIELLSENKELLQSGLLTFDSGLLTGQFANENNLLQGQFNGPGSLSGTKILQHPNGFVYRWKTGIFTATLAADTEDPLREDQATLKTLQQTYGLTVAQDVLTNLDIANILSLLIVGQPYNVETFVEQAYQVHNIGKQSASASFSSTDPLAAVLDVVRRQNIRFGGFKPYRMITLSNSTIEQTASSNIQRQEINQNISRLQARRNELQNLIRQLSSVNDVVDNPLIRTLRAEIAAIDDGIADQLSVIRQSGSISSTGLLASNFNLFGRNRVLPLTDNFNADHEVTRAMMLVGAQRRIEDVRLNRDDNLFIVSDQYDQNTDIRPYIVAFQNSNYEIFQGEFIDVFSKCKAASEIANLEFFCNTQGHLEFRPPQWNKTPLTVLERLFQIDKDGTKGIVPEFLKETFETRSSSLRREVHALNIKIVMLSLQLGKFPDSSIIPNFPLPRAKGFLAPGESSSSGSLRFFGVDPKGLKGDAENAFTLQRGETKNRFQIGNLVNTGNQLVGEGLSLRGAFGEEGDVIRGDTDTLLGIFDPIFQEEVGLINNVLTTARNAESFPAREYATANNLNRLREDFRKLAGIDPAADILGPTGRFTEESFVFNIGGNSQDAEMLRFGKVQDILQKLQKAISERDRVVSILIRNEQKQEELEEIESILAGEFTGAQEDGGLDPDSVLGGIDAVNTVVDALEKTSEAIGTVTDIFNGEATKGSLFDHLVADDTRNLLGPGSGKRYIIRDEDIISCDFQEDPPDFVRVNVVGDAPFLQPLQESFQNKYFWAGATDFDLWRQYGYLATGPKNLPFASNPETQCKPFAILELQLQKVGINKGSLTVVGNEYYQPGDVVFVRGQGLLYYVRSVRHNFQWGNSFTTTLILENGHPPGEYLPSPLDIIGQQYLENPIQGSTIIYRNQRGDDSYRVLQPDSTLVFPRSIDPSEDNIPVLLDFRDNQVRFTNMMINLNSTVIGERLILIRGFVRGRADPDIDRVRQALTVMKGLLQNPVQISQSQPNGLGDDFLDFASGVVRTLGGSTGTTKNTVPMFLPNGQQVTPIDPTKIVEQIVFLDGNESSSEIQCLNPSLNSDQSSNDRNIEIEDLEAVFPKGGPKQRTWLDIRDNFDDLSTVIEVGILDIARRIGETSENRSLGDGIDVSVEF